MARRKAPKTWEQVEATRQKAVRFLRDVVGDDDLADEFDDMSTEEYAEHKGIEVVENPSSRNANTERKTQMAGTKRQPTRAELQEQVEDLQGQVDDLQEDNDDLTDRLDQIADLTSTEDDKDGDDQNDDQDDDDQD